MIRNTALIAVLALAFSGLAYAKDEPKADTKAAADPIVKARMAAAAAKPDSTKSKDLQDAITPDMAIKMLKDGNTRFTTGAMTKRDLKKQVKDTGKGQYPFASIVSCIDSRSAPELVFDQGIGDLFVARVAANESTKTSSAASNLPTRLPVRKSSSSSATRRAAASRARATTSSWATSRASWQR